MDRSSMQHEAGMREREQEILLGKTKEKTKLAGTCSTKEK
jgi:hypothetical protein